MDVHALEILGGVAGLGGAAVGLILLLYREIVRKNIFPRLSPKDAYRLLRHIAVLSWSVAMVGIVCWAWTQSLPHSSEADQALRDPRPSEPLVIAGTVVDQVTNEGIPQATLSIDGDQAAGVTSEDNGNFRIVLAGKSSNRLRLRATKHGYLGADQSVLPPAHDVILQMSRPK